MGKAGKKFLSAKKAFEDKQDLSLEEAIDLLKIMPQPSLMKQ